MRPATLALWLHGQSRASCACIPHAGACCKGQAGRNAGRTSLCQKFGARFVATRECRTMGGASGGAQAHLLLKCIADSQKVHLERLALAFYHRFGSPKPASSPARHEHGSELSAGSTRVLGLTREMSTFSLQKLPCSSSASVNGRVVDFQQRHF